MQTIEYRTVDKSEWPRGEWDDEPDKVQWPDPATGLPCIARRAMRGNWCGYVGVAPGHPLHGRDYDSVGEHIECHGGLTFAEACEPNAHAARDICHLADAGEPEHVHWFGFDCAHYTVTSCRTPPTGFLFLPTIPRIVISPMCAPNAPASRRSSPKPHITQVHSSRRALEQTII